MQCPWARILVDLLELESLTAPLPTVAETARAVVGDAATDLVGRVTVNLAPIRGGELPNLLAARAEAGLDVRVPPGLHAAAVLERLQAIIGRHPEAALQVDSVAEPSLSDPGAPIFQAVAGAAEEVFGRRPLPSVALGGSDARLWAYAGIPACIFGPRPYGAGGPDEHVLVEDLLRAARVYALAAYDFLCGTDRTR